MFILNAINNLWDFILDDLLPVVPFLYIFGGLFYLVYLRPKIEEKHDICEFDNRVLGFVDGLYLSGMDLKCSEYEFKYDIYQYVKEQLAKAHKLPGTQSLIEYTSSQGSHYCSHTEIRDYALFAVLCIAQYAQEHELSELLSWCDSALLSAKRHSMDRLRVF